MTDISKNVQTLIKRAYNVPSTYHNTKWWNEKCGKYQTIIEGEDINVQTPPETPIWSTDASMTDSELSGLDMSIVTADSFSSQDCSFVETYVDSDYSMNFGMSPGAYLDSTGTVALFVRLKLDKMFDGSQHEYGVDSNAIAYVKYPTDSSLNSILSNAYQFNYNAQLDVSENISLFQPYKYTLEYSTDDTSFITLTNDEGPWNFDFKSGIITFEDSPSVVLTDSNAALYFTFVKYVGLCGVNNLDTINGDLSVGGTLYVGASDGSSPGKIHLGGADGDIGYNYSTIETRLYGERDYSEMLLFQGNDLGNSSGPDRIRLYTGEIWFDVPNTTNTTAAPSSTSDQTNGYTSTTAMMISNDAKVGIGTTSPSCTLDVSGDANISSDLTVGGDLTVGDNSSFSYDADDDYNITVWGTTRLNYGVTIGGENGLDGGLTITNKTSTNGAETVIIQSDIDGGGIQKNSEGRFYQNTSNNDRKLISIQPYGGSIGIGTETPSDTLDVNGSANITTTLEVGTNLTVGGDTDISGGLSVFGNCLIDANLDNYAPLTIEDGFCVRGAGSNIDFRVNADGVIAEYDLSVNRYLSVGNDTDITGDLTVGGDVYATYGFVITGTQNDDAYFSSYDGAFWRQDGQVVITVDDYLYFKHRSAGSLDNASFCFYMTSASKTNAKLGIGTGSGVPTYPLHITNTVTDSSVPMYLIGNGHVDHINGDVGTKSGSDGSRTRSDVGFWYQNTRIGDIEEGTDGGLIWEWTSSDIPISVYATGAFVSEQTFATTSDRRIKTNIVDISDDEALVQFRKLQPKKYNYIDFKKKTTQQVYGFIAQEIAQEIPNSTTQTSDFIPDLYCYGEVDVCNNTIKLLQKSIIIDSSNQNIVIQDTSLNIDLSVNDTLKCYDASNTEFEIEVSNIEIVENIETLDTEYILTIDAGNIELSKHSYYNIGDPSGNILHNNLVFVYGKKVDDLHHVKKDSIWTVAAAALQEVDRQQQADKVRISELETEVTTLKNQVSTFETQMSELLARVSSLETNNSTTTTDASDNTTTTDDS